jgi:hypothetical protein
MGMIKRVSGSTFSAKIHSPGAYCEECHYSQPVERARRALHAVDNAVYGVERKQNRRPRRPRKSFSERSHSDSNATRKPAEKRSWNDATGRFEPLSSRSTAERP